MCLLYELLVILYYHCTTVICLLITFRVRRSRGEMYIGHGRLCLCVCLCVCLSVPRLIPTLLHGLGCNLRE